MFPTANERTLAIIKLPLPIQLLAAITEQLCRDHPGAIFRNGLGNPKWLMIETGPPTKED